MGLFQRTIVLLAAGLAAIACGDLDVETDALPVIGAACTGAGQGTCDAGEACTAGFCERDVDSDGLGDSIDVDDDNDGILDTVECPPVGTPTGFERTELDLDLNGIHEPSDEAGIITSSNGDYDANVDWLGWTTPGGTVDYSEGQYVEASSSSAHTRDTTDGLGVLPSPAGGGFAIFSFGTEDVRQTITTVPGQRYSARYWVGVMPNYDNAVYNVSLSFGVDQAGTADDITLDQGDITVPPFAAFNLSFAAATAAEPGATSVDINPFWQTVDLEFTANAGGTATMFFQVAGNNAVIVVDALELRELRDTDGDGIEDCHDLDSDNDGINDVQEAGGIDLNRDGFADDRDGDGTNNNGIPSTAGAGLSAPDGDADGATDPVDVDSDDPDETTTGDGIDDDIDATALSGDDANGDGVLDSTVDPDGDGIMLPADFVPGAYRDGAPDQDADGIADEVDIDDDDDGIPDVTEGSADPDGDGIGNSLDLDSDGDGIPDAAEAGHQNPETGASTCVGATTFNGLCDSLETALDNGVINYTIRDTDGDLVADFLDRDADGDGVVDAQEAGHGDDADGDGEADCASGVGANGLCDGLESAADSGVTDYGVAGSPDPARDFDGDGLPDYRDLDADNDGINDVVEAAGLDADNNGLQDAASGTPDSDGDGLIDSVDPDEGGTPLVPPNSDGDANPNMIDLDSDNDSVSDLVEGGSGGLDANADGVVDGGDADLDGIRDSVDGDPAYGDAGSPTPPDADSGDDANSPDYTDTTNDTTGEDDIDRTEDTGLDADDDGEIDDLTDTDGDGIPDVDDESAGFGGSSPSAACGNGLVNVDEGCDDGGILPGDGCSASCLIEDGGTCNLAPPGLVDDASCESGTCSLTNVCGVDTDGDGVADIDDLDDDNDGIPDTVEGSGAIDTDGDGVADSLDLDSDDDGILDVVEAGHDGADADTDGTVDCTYDALDNGLCDDLETAAESGVTDYDSDAAGPDAPINTDGAGPADWRDLDSDDDGITDLEEGGSGCVNTTPVDGTCDGDDDDGDGIVNDLDGLGGFGDDTYEPPTDTDGAGNPDYRQLDSDGDGIFDVVEGDSGCTDLAPTDGRCDGADGDGDGIDDDVSSFDPTDFDGDGQDDYQDLDSDNDGILDAVEGTVDTDNDTRPDFRDLDSDNDGIYDVVEGQSGCTDAAPADGICDGPFGGDGLDDAASGDDPPDTDGDGAADFRDLDSDNDGAPDIIEDESTCTDTTPRDSVCDGAADASGVTPGVTADAPTDSDGDGVPDYLDLDSDDDGLSDLLEVASGCADANADAVCDGPDVDGDGVPSSIDDDDAVFGDPGSIDPPNADGQPDGADYVDLDSDDDGNPDLDAADCLDANPADDRCDGPDSDGDGGVDAIDDFDGFGLARDTDNDGVGDDLDLDDDNDGIPDTTEGSGAVDTDGDGVSDMRDLDSDNDGLSDALEAGHTEPDSDGSGSIDCAGGVGANGLCDSLETAADSGLADYDGDGSEDAPVDTDGDGIGDWRDLDSDNDGASDLDEGGGQCDDAAPSNNVCDAPDDDRDGVANSQDDTDGFGAGGGFEAAPDTDGDGIPDFRDLDSDGDGIFDVDEGNNPGADTDNDGDVDGEDVDGDGIIDTVDDSDGDGTPDADDSDGGGFGSEDEPERDTDGDDDPDRTDTDSDDDGVDDEDEAGDDPTDPVDTDGDGDPDFQDSDSDGDTIDDGPDNCRLIVNDDQVDTDSDGLGDACDDDDNNDGLEDDLGLQGGGCSTSSSAGGVGQALGLLGIVMLLGLARRRRLAPIAALALVGLIATGDADAQVEIATEYPVERFRLSSDRDGIIDAEWAGVMSHLSFDAGLWLSYADDPLNVYRREDGGDRERVASLVSSRLGGTMVGSVGLYERFQLGLAVPLILSQADDTSGLTMMPASPKSFGLGDLRFIPKLAVLRQRQHGVHLGVLVGLTVPTSSADDFFGDTGVVFAPELLLSRSFSSGLRLAANVGYRMREETIVVDLEVDDELFTHLGVGYRFADRGGPPLELDLTYAVATGADDIFGAFNRNYSELKAGASYDIRGPLILFGAAGLGTTEGFGSPDWRLAAGLRFALAKDKKAPTVIVDTDGDGIADADDKCPKVPESNNGIEDSDGCPEDDDPDGDGILAGADECPTEAEDKDSFEDADGCPDPDNDADSILDVDDACPDVAEDLDGFEDDNGCPEPDNDKDTILDGDDACPLVAGTVERNGCPVPDRDGDTVADDVDNCPDKAGTVEYQGCDKPQQVRITSTGIEILDVVYFRTNRDIIRKRSYDLLRNVATVINNHPELPKIRVEGHTDDRGSDRYNLKLSQRRAESVVRFLTRAGVDASRLEAQGFGEEQPIADNDTKENRAKNRRVEFKIVGDAKIENRNSGPTDDTIDN